MSYGPNDDPKNYLNACKAFEESVKEEKWWQPGSKHVAVRFEARWQSVVRPIAIEAESLAEHWEQETETNQAIDFVADHDLGLSGSADDWLEQEVSKGENEPW